MVGGADSAPLTVGGAGKLYDGFKSSGLQYGTSFRTLTQAWGGANDGAARLQARASSGSAIHVHPADLDDALCASALMEPSVGNATSETRLPFSVDDAQLQRAPGESWAVRKLPHHPAISLPGCKTFCVLF